MSDEQANLPVEADILDDLRRAESLNKQRLFLKNLSNIRKLARAVQEAKAEIEAILESVGVKDKDTKRVIDFVNELDDVKMTDEQRKAINERVRKNLAEDRREAQKSTDEALLKHLEELANRPPKDHYTSGFVTTTTPYKNHFYGGVTGGVNWKQDQNTVYCASISNDGRSSGLKLTDPNSNKSLNISL